METGENNNEISQVKDKHEGNVNWCPGPRQVTGEAVVPVTEFPCLMDCNWHLSTESLTSVSSNMRHD